MRVSALGCAPGPRSNTIIICREDFTVGTISGPTVFECATATTARYSITPVPGATYTWSQTGGAGVVFGSQIGDGSSADYRVNSLNAGNTSGAVTVTITRCGLSRTQTLNISRPFPSGSIEGSEVCFGLTTSFTGPAGSNHVWTIDPAGQFTVTGSGRTIQVRPRFNNSQGILTVTYNRPCDNLQTSTSVDLFTVSNCGRGGRLSSEELEEPFAVYPVPAKDVLHVVGLPGFGAKRLLLFDQLGRLAKETNTGERSVDLSLKGLPTGMYMLQVSGDEGFLENRRIVVGQ